MLGFPLSACSLIGLENDEIDIAAEETGGGAETGAEGMTGDPTGDTGGAEAGDGDGDTDTGDGDPGDGDGDPGDGDGDPGDGDGDGDGDGEAAPCDDYNPTEAGEGEHPVDIPEGDSLFESDCGAPGPEALFVYTAGADGLVQFAFTEDSEAEAAVYLLGESCGLGVESLVCALTPEPAQLMMSQGQTVYVVVDLFDTSGSGTLDITLN